MVMLIDRHDADLDGQILGRDARRAVSVEVTLEDDSAGTASVQHAAWMLCNLLVRLERRVVSRVRLVTPRGLRLLPFVIPGTTAGDDFGVAVTTLLSSLNRSPISANGGATDIRFIVGPGPSVTDCYRVFGEGWWGGFTRLGIVSRLNDGASVGPYTAACLAAGEVFKRAALPTPQPFPESLFYSLWDFRPLATAPDDLPLFPNGAHVRATLAGVGAVGCAFIHALWSSSSVTGDIVLVDNDSKGVDETNLNRYVLFFLDSLGRAKAREAVKLATRPGLACRSIDDTIEVVARAPNEFILSAVDTDDARRAIQLRYPARILGASTSGLRAELLRAGPAGTRACLSCAGVERTDSDDAVLARIDPSNPRLLGMGFSSEEVHAVKVERIKCGRVKVDILEAQRALDRAPEEFAVGFVSAMAGTMLAAAAVKESIQAGVPLNDDINRAVLQFFNPLATANRASPMGRNARCPVCDPVSRATKIWSARQTKWSPG